MRTRTIMTVAILSAAGCGTTGAARQAQAPMPVDAAPPTATVAAAPTPAPAPTVTAVPAPVIASSVATAPAAPLTPGQLEDLAVELRGADPKTVAVQLAHFRPLCDAQGYPLVGNLMTKSIDDTPGPITAYCADVRARMAP